MSAPNSNLSGSFDLRAYRESVVKIQDCLGRIASLANLTYSEINDDTRIGDRAREIFSELEKLAIRMQTNIAVTRRSNAEQKRLVEDFDVLSRRIIGLPAGKRTILGKHRREMMEALAHIEERWKIATDVPAQPHSIRFSLF